MLTFTPCKENAQLSEAPFSTTRDGLTIRGTCFRPREGRLPAAIVCHGFMGTEGTVRQYALPLAEAGFATFTFDFCGGSAADGKSDGATTDMTVLTQVRDLEAVLAHVQTLPFVDASRILLAGGSQGGFVCALTAARHPDLPAGLILIYPALCIPDDARRGQMMFARFDPEHIPDTIPCGPMLLGGCYPKAVIGLDPFAEIAPYRGPVLLVHGTADELVLPAYSERARQAYLASCPPGMPQEQRVQLHLIEGGGHGFTPQEDRVCIGHMLAFVHRLGLV